MMQYKASSVSRFFFYIRLAPSPRGANAIKLVRFVTLMPVACKRARARAFAQIVPEVSSGVNEARSFARRTLRNAKCRSECALWVLEGTEIDKDKLTL